MLIDASQMLLTSDGELIPFFTGSRLLAPAPSKKARIPASGSRFYQFILPASAQAPAPAPSKKARLPAPQLPSSVLLVAVFRDLNRLRLPIGLAAPALASNNFFIGSL